MRYDDEGDWPEKHPACRCGCGELADECPRGSWASNLGGGTARSTFDLRAGVRRD